MNDRQAGLGRRPRATSCSSPDPASPVTMTRRPSANGASLIAVSVPHVASEDCANIAWDRVSDRRTSPCPGRARGTTRPRVAPSSVPNASTNASASAIETLAPAAGRARRRSRAWRVPSRRPHPTELARPTAARSPPPRRTGTTRSRIPSACASSARTCRPLQISSLARAGPIEPGQPLRAAGAGKHAEQDLGLADARVLRRRRAGRT